MEDRHEHFAAFRDEILADLRHEDDRGVYEIWWTANTRYPRLPLSSRLRLAEEVVTDLVKSGQAVLYRTNVLTPESRRAIDDQLAVLRQASTWIPASDEQVWIESND